MCMYAFSPKFAVSLNAFADSLLGPGWGSALGFEALGASKFLASVVRSLRESLNAYVKLALKPPTFPQSFLKPFASTSSRQPKTPTPKPESCYVRLCDGSILLSPARTLILYMRPEPKIIDRLVCRVFVGLQILRLWALGC